MNSISVPSPVGTLRVSEENGAIVSVSWSDRPGAGVETPVLAEARRQLAAYFADGRQGFDLPLAPRGTAFQQGVWRLMCAIPAGRTMSYGEMARALGAVARAVGQACGENPIPIIIPCHRVLAAGGGDGGYSGRGGVATKRWLLVHEGAPVQPVQQRLL